MPECGEKIRHPTRDDALAHVKRLIWKNHSAGQPERSAGLAVYPCEHCQTWHVGHQRSAPLVWHYTVVRLLDPILESDALEPPAPRLVFDLNTVPPEVRRRYPDGCLPLSRSFVTRAETQRLPRMVEVPVPGTRFRIRASRLLVELAPLLWFSRDAAWEHSVRITGHPGRENNEMGGGGLLRFGVRASFAKLRWSDYIERNPTPTRMRDALAGLGNPTEWLATDEAIPLSDVHAMEVYYRGQWTPVANVTDEKFDRYLEERSVVYAAARESLASKLEGTDGEAIADVPQMSEAEAIVYEDRWWQTRERLDPDQADVTELNAALTALRALIRHPIKASAET
jgi:hypothetical protein